MRETPASRSPCKTYFCRRCLYTTRHPLGLTLDDDGICSGCNIAVPPQSFIELQRGQQILSCPNCQRLIFWCEHFSLPEEAVAAPKPVPQTD